MQFIKKFIPPFLLKKIRPVYHGLRAWGTSIYYGNPSSKLFVIGITGTAGKSTTAALLSHILNQAGKKTGYMTTVNFFDGKKDFINKHGLSMPGGPKIQAQLNQLVDNKCEYAIVECTSEGLAQNRHLGIDFQMALLTNLSPAHIESHGSFENYKKAKGKLFAIAKMVGVNLDDESADYFLSFKAKNKFGVSLKNRQHLELQKNYLAEKTEVGFNLQGQTFSLQLPAEFNKYNALLAVAAANVLGVSLSAAAKSAASFSGIRGRMEKVNNNLGLNIYVDYGCEPASFKAALLAANALPHKNLIHIFGTTGGHRDVSKRFAFGRCSAELADVSIITNDDVYDSDPEEIVSNEMEGYESISSDKRKSKAVYKILDRRQAIAKALAIAQPDDLVLITGKGSEQFLVLPGNKRVEWDEVEEIKKVLSYIHNP